MTVWDMIQDVRQGLARLGIAASKSSDPREVFGTFQKLRPRVTEHPLVRIGCSTDGGYLVPDDLLEISGVFSPGVAETAEFEMHFASEGTPCYLIDGSIAQPPVFHENIHFEPLWLSSRSVIGHSISLSDWLGLHAAEGADFLLQMDIEGAEYECLLSADASTLKSFRIIVLELHDFQSITNRMGSRLINLLLERLLETHHLVHTHVNNTTKPFWFAGLALPDTLELTLIRKDRVSHLGDYAVVPNRLDSPNTSNKDWHLFW